jgi:hypothetical protein
MDIGTILAGLQAIASISQSMNQAPQLTPAQAEKEKPKKVEPLQPITPIMVVLPNQTPPMGVGVPPPPPPLASDYRNQLPPANVLRKSIWRMIQPPDDVAPVFRGFPPSTEAPIYLVPFDPLLTELYDLYFGSRR